MSFFSGSSEDFYAQLQSHVLPNSIKILMIGDVVGQPGRKIVKSVLSKLRNAAGIDFVTLNGENLAGGFGITEKIFKEVLEMGVDVVTMGNHWSDKPDVHKIRAQSPLIVLPQNLKGVSDVEKIPEFDIPSRNKTVCILNLMGIFAMRDPYNSPFSLIQDNLGVLRSKVQSGQTILIADVHAEASSEKQAIAWHLDGVLAAFIGTHTHTPTSDERITEKGTAFLTDVGMCGPYDSVIGMNKERSVARFFTPQEKRPQEVAKSNCWFTGFLVEVSPTTCLAIKAHRLQFREEEDLWQLSSVLPKKPT